MKPYIDLANQILNTGNRRGDRTGTGTISMFGPQLRFDLSKGFPLLTTKKMFMRGIIEELLWILNGDTNNNTLVDKNVHIWDEWAVDYSVDFPMFSKEFAELLGEQFPEKLEAYLEYEKQHGEVILSKSDEPLLKLWEVQQWAITNNIQAIKKKPILTLDDRIHWMSGMCDPVISKQINYEYCLNGVLKRDDDDNIIAKLDELGVPPITSTHGALGPVYGEQWRSWKGKVIGMENVTPTSHDGEIMQFVGEPVREKIDQIQMLIDGLKNKPFSRRHIVSAWNVEDLPDESISPQANVAIGKMALAPCHCLFQFYVRELSFEERATELANRFPEYLEPITSSSLDDEIEELFTNYEIPKYKLDCQLYQR